MKKLNLQEIDLSGKKVLMRVDYNVPLNPDGSIADDTRIRESLESIRYILDSGGSVILMSHLGRPGGKAMAEFSLSVCAKALSSLLGQPVLMATDCVGPEVEALAQNLQEKQVLLLENLRFHAAEEKPSLDPSFAKKLAQLGDTYVNDAFGTAHRKHSSTAVISQYFPQRAAAGFLMQKEIDFLSKLFLNPTAPFYAIIGGSKISTKIGVLTALASKANGIFIGGAMAFTFFKAQGIAIGKSLCEESEILAATDFLKTCKEKNIPVFLPKDMVIADALRADAQTRTVSMQEGIPEGWMGVDIADNTISEWEEALQKAATVFWNGPLGVFEIPSFAKGTEQIARCLSALSATTVVGGGDSVAAINRLHLASKFSHISTGGGASLEFIEYGRLPGIDALSDISTETP